MNEFDSYWENVKEIFRLHQIQHELKSGPLETKVNLDEKYMSCLVCCSLKGQLSLYEQLDAVRKELNKDKEISETEE